MISIIIPVYNTSKYLKACLDSFVNQLNEQVEIILVDDCSTDNSLEICKEYATKYSNFKPLAQTQNMGVSAARNLGLEIAKGEYVAFVDSDDLVAENYVERLISFSQSGFDLISFGHYDYVHNGNERYAVKESAMNLELESNDIKKQDWETLLLKSFFASPWNKLYKKCKLISIIDGAKKDLRFDERCVCFEDFLFNLEYCKNILNFTIVSEPLYYYRQNNSVKHISKRKWGERFRVSNLVSQKTNEFIALKGEADLSFLRRYTFTAFITELQFAYYFNNSTFKQAIKEIAKNDGFKLAVKSIKPAGKTLTVLKLAQRFKLYGLQKRILIKLIAQ